MLSLDSAIKFFLKIGEEPPAEEYATNVTLKAVIKSKASKS